MSTTGLKGKVGIGRTTEKDNHWAKIYVEIEYFLDEPNGFEATCAKLLKQLETPIDEKIDELKGNAPKKSVIDGESAASREATTSLDQLKELAETQYWNTGTYGQWTFSHGKDQPMTTLKPLVDAIMKEPKRKLKIDEYVYSYDANKPDFIGRKPA